MRLPLYQIDAFASEVFRVDPAAVCPLEPWLPAAALVSPPPHPRFSRLRSFFASSRSGLS